MVCALGNTYMLWAPLGTLAVASMPLGKPPIRRNDRKTDRPKENMSKELTRLANQLRSIDFPDDDNILDNAFHERSNASGAKSCYPLPGGNLWVVKFSIGGKIQCVGFTPDGQTAGRFADMARVRFHKYRLRGSWKPIEDTDLNFDLAQVASDQNEVQEAVALLDSIEHLLLADGVIVDHKQIEAKRAELVQDRVSRRPVGKEILERVIRIEALLAQFVALNKL